MSLSDNLRALENAGLISQAGAQTAPGFTFRHALVQQAVYNTFLKGQRRRVHQVIVEVLEQAGAEPADLAYHSFEAGQWTQAVDYARQAALRARAQYAPREAISLFNLGLEAARELRAPPPDDLLRLRGQAHEVLGDYEQAEADYTAALDLTRAAGRGREEWELLLDLGLLWAARDYSRTGDYYRQAMWLAQKQGNELALGHSLNRLGNWHFNMGENLAALELHQGALEIFQRQQAPRGLAETYDLLGMVQTIIGRTRQGKASYELAIALFREQDDRLGLISCLATLAEQGPSIHADTAAYVAPRAEAEAHGRQALQMAREIGFRAGEAYALCSLAGVLVSQGDYAVVLRELDLALRIAQEIDHRQWQTFAHNIYALACLDLFQMEAALHHAQQAYQFARELNSALWIASTTAINVLVHLERGELDRSDALLDRHPLPNSVAPSLHVRLLASMRAEMRLARGDPAGALRIVNDLIATTPDLPPGQPVPRLWHQRGRARAALGQPDAGMRDLQQACTGSTAHGSLPLVWRMQVDLARLYDAHGRPAEAEQARAAAHALVAQLAAGVADPAWRTHFLAQATRRIHRKD